MPEGGSIRLPEAGDPGVDDAGNDAKPEVAWPDLDVWPQSGAVCCSGGGIRSASYCLGALQALDASGVQPKLITAVSGGSYIAASWALMSQGIDPATDEEAPPCGTYRNGTPGGAAQRPYRPGSPEEQHLRTHTRYIAPNFRVGLIGVASLLVGALLTVALVSSLLFVFGQLLGAFLAHFNVLTGLNSPDPAADLSKWPWWIWVVAGGVVGLSLLWIGWPGVVRAGLERRVSFVAVQAGAVALLLALAMVLIPLAVAGLFRFGLYNGGAGGTVVRGLGFASTSACSEAYTAQYEKLPNPQYDTVCGVDVVRRKKNISASSGNPVARVVAFFAAVAGLAKAAAGRWFSPTQGGQGKSWIQRLSKTVRGFVVPWLGTIIIVAAFALATLRWTADGNLSGFRWWVLLLLLVPLLGRLFVDVNRMSLHDFYRWRLSEAYGYSKKLASTTKPRARDKRKVRSRRLSELTCGPTLAICTSANASAYGETPAGLDAFLFRFDREEATLYGPRTEGRPHVVEARTKDYETLAGLTLFDLVAISGAAVSPLMGKATRQAMRVLLTVANARLGVWLPNPKVVRDARTWVDQHCFHEFKGEESDPCETCGEREDFAAHLREGQTLAETNLNWTKDNRVGKRPRWPLLPLLKHMILRVGNSDELWGRALWYQEHAAGRKAGPQGQPKGRTGSRSVRAWMLWRAMQPTLGLLWKEAVASSGYRGEWVYASDGGHYENLGLVAALHDDSVHHVIALDASGDKTDTWNTIGQAMALARTDADVEIDLDPTTMNPSPGDDPAYVTYPLASGTFRRHPGRNGFRPHEPKTFLLAYKLGVWKGAPWDVRSYAATHKAFPCTSTGQQLYDGDEFEAYRALGSAAVLAARTPPRHRMRALLQRAFG